MNNSNINKAKKGRHNYLLSVRGCGSEMVLGTISDGFGTYWRNQSKYKVRDYLFSAEDERQEVANDGAISVPWHELDDLGHANGPYIYGSQFKVFDVYNEKTLKFNMTDIDTHLPSVETKYDFRSKTIRSSTGVVRLQRHQSYYGIYGIRTDREFDISLLKLHETKLEGLSMLDSVTYNDNELDIEDWDEIPETDSVLLLPRKMAK